jgi:ATP-dependent DNA ligase
MTTLYKLTNTALLSWSITTEDCKVLIEHGQVSGKKQIDIIHCASAKLAVVEMDRRVEHKKNHQGYTQEVPKAIPELPMLANVYNPKKLPSHVFIQPKLDGIRCIATNYTMISRRGEPITSMPHIQQELDTLPPGIRFDGELYCHGITFQEHLSLIKRHKTHNNFYKINYHIFDIQSDTTSFTDRYRILRNILENKKFNYIELVPTRLIESEHVDKLCHQHFSDYEGAILRDPEATYQYNTRTDFLQKYKWEQTEECRIIDIVASNSGREAGAAIFVCERGEITFRVRPKMSMHERCYILSTKKSHIGKWTRVTYNGLSTNNVPLKPRAEGMFDKPEDCQ